MEDQPAAAGGRVDRLGEGPEPDLAGLQLVDGLDQVLEAPAQPVEPPDDEGVAGSGEVEGVLEPVALNPGAALWDFDYETTNEDGKKVPARHSSGRPLICLKNGPF